jgi:hypothetical protein
MKTTLIKLLALSGIALLLMPACKKSDTLVTSNGGTPGTLTASSMSPTLNKASVGDVTTQVITFNFTKATYNFNAAVTYTLQIDKPSDNWKTPTSVTFANGVTSQSYDTYDFDNLLLKLGLPGGVATTVNVRLVQTVSSYTSPIYSNVLTLNVTPFNLTSWIYVTGAFQGWNAASPDSLISTTSNGIYTGIINFTAGNNQFLILPAKNFNNKYATTQTSTPTTTVTYNAGNNLIAPATAGQYLVTYNMNTGSITFQLADYYTIIGDAAIDWNTDNYMKYVNDGTGTWVITGLSLNTTGAFKIRQDAQWTNSWGIPNSGSAGYGIANTLNSTSNSNITVSAAGTYTVKFVGNATVYGTKVDANSGDNNIVTTTYSVVKTN